MPEAGFLLSESNFNRTRETVLAYESDPRNIIKHRRRSGSGQPPTSPLFLYQALYPIRLRAGTFTFPKDTAKSEPVIFCIRLGTVSEKPKLLYGPDLVNVNNAINGSPITGPDGRIEQQSVENIINARTLNPIITTNLDGFDGFYLLRARFIQSYIYSGCMLIGNEEEALYSLGRQRLTATMTDSLHEDVETALATLVNTASNPTEDGVVTEDVLIRDPLQWDAVYLYPAQDVQCTWQNQTWFGDETAANSDMWAQHLTHGWLPVLDADPSLGRDFVGKTRATVTAPNYVTVYPYGGDDQEALEEQPLDGRQVYVRYGDGGDDKWIKAKAYPYGWEGEITECP